MQDPDIGLIVVKPQPPHSKDPDEYALRQPVDLEEFFGGSWPGTLVTTNHPQYTREG